MVKTYDLQLAMTYGSTTTTEINQDYILTISSIPEFYGRQQHGVQYRKRSLEGQGPAGHGEA